MRWVYAGELGPDGGLDWNGPPGGNIPKAGMVPDLLDSGLYQLVRQLAWAGKYDGRDPDFDASAIKVNGDELRGLLEENFGPERLARPGADLKAYLTLATSLGADRYIALVAVAM